MSIEGYRYFDTEDRITERFVAQHEPYPGYWHHSEVRALERTRARAADILVGATHWRGLDAGCGEGRLLPWLASIASPVTAIDPDPRRLDGARRHMAHDPTIDVNFRVSSIADFADEPFDLVLCSHVLQHVPVADIAPILANLHTLTRSGGLLVLSYSRAPVAGGWFSVTRLVDGHVESWPVDRTVFDGLAGGAPDPDGALPVHHVDPDELRSVGAAIGWTERWRWTYHLLDELALPEDESDRDEWANRTGRAATDRGRDVMVVWQREPPRAGSS